LIDEKVRKQLGLNETQAPEKFRAKSMDYNCDGILIISFEQNIILKYDIT